MQEAPLEPASPATCVAWKELLLVARARKEKNLNRVRFKSAMLELPRYIESDRDVDARTTTGRDTDVEARSECSQYWRERI